MKNHNNNNVFKTAIAFISVMLISGCQLTSETGAQVSNLNHSQSDGNQVCIDYGYYYSSLRSLSTSELLEEVETQKQALSSSQHEARMKIALLYSLPKSPIYNVYSAKTVLNKHTQSLTKENIGAHNLAFLSLLKDQLNQQIKLIASNNVIDELLLDNEVKSNEIQALEFEVAGLLKKIEQLRKIEKVISSHRYR
ncbi:MAG: hypothetical protein ACPGTQ_01790 [Colwellia sp.]